MIKIKCRKKLIKKVNDTVEIVYINQLIMLIVQRGFNPDHFASHELLSYPKALSDAKGFMEKSNKSELMNEIEVRMKCCSISPIYLSTSYPKLHIFDAMVIVHVLQLKNYRSFGEFAHVFLNYITTFFEQPNTYRIDIVFDRYDNLGVRHAESLLRAKNKNLYDIFIQGPKTKIPSNSNDLLNNPKNKLELVKFLCQNASNYIS